MSVRTHHDDRRAWRRLAILATALSVMTSPTSARAQVFADGKGINSASAVLGMRATPTSPSVYQMMPQRWSPAIIKQIRASGFTFIRLVTTPAPLMTDDPVALQHALDWLSMLVDQANAAGLSVVVDLHPWPSDGPWDQDRIIADSAHRAALGKAQVALGRMLAGKKGAHVAFELLNEPPCIGPDKKPIDWPAIQLPMERAVRAVAPTLPLVLTGCRGQPDRLSTIDAAPYAGDPNIFWTFHYYQPATFVWQEQSGLTDIPFPPDPSLANSPTALHAMIPMMKLAQQPGTLMDVRNYLLNDHGSTTIAANMDAISAWAKRYGFRTDHILMGEFGNSISTKNPDIETTHAAELRWTIAVRSQAERHGFAWAYWNATGITNPDYDPHTRFYNDTLLGALGVKKKP